MARADRRDQRIRLEVLGPGVANELNEPERAWVLLAQTFAEVRYGNAMERREASRDQASMTATFVVEPCGAVNSLTVEDSIVHNGLRWNIAGIASMARDEVQISAVAAVEVV